VIVSFRHGFVFVAVPRTGTHTVRALLAPHLGPEDWRQQALHGQAVLPVPELAAVGHGHLTIAQVRPHLPAPFRERALSFAFVREPLDRFVSACAFLFRRDADFARDPVGRVRTALRFPRFRNRVLLRPQWTFLCGPDGELAVDFVGRHERFAEDLAEVCTRIGLPAAAGPERHNESPREAAGALGADPEIRRAVEELYARDRSLFAYDAPEPPTPPS
jgi:hypothetical protein